MYRDSPMKIESAVQAVIQKLKQAPLPVFNATVAYVPTLANYEMLMQFIQVSLLYPYSTFPTMAKVFADLEAGNGDSLVTASGFSELMDPVALKPSLYNSAFPSMIIECVDVQSGPRLQSIEEFRDYADMMIGKTRYHGAVKSTAGVMCKDVFVEVPMAGRTTIGRDIPYMDDEVDADISQTTFLWDPVQQMGSSSIPTSMTQFPRSRMWSSAWKGSQGRIVLK